jgi:hypothetical protein
MISRRTSLAVAASAAAAALVLAGCGSKPAASPDATRPTAGITGPALATSLSGSAASWAVVEMGGSAAQHNNFWELFERPETGTGWKLATPSGVASNGGLVAAVTGPAGLVTGFRPSQDLVFSPLTGTNNGGTSWSTGGVVSSGLADLPGALAAGPAGRLLAVTDSGDIETGSVTAANWTRLTTRSALSRGAGRACQLTAVTAAAWTPGGQPLVAGDCRQPGTVGIFVLRAGTWHATGPALPATLARDPVSVIGLSTTGTRITALLAAGTGAGTGLVAAWSSDGASTWTLSPKLSTGPATAGPPSVSFGSDGSASVALPARHAVTGGATIGWQTASWRSLPTLPARTATLATSSGGQPEALAVDAGTLTAWELATPSAVRWTLAQTIHVPIPYGSSG